MRSYSARFSVVGCLLLAFLACDRSPKTVVENANVVFNSQHHLEGRGVHAGESIPETRLTEIVRQFYVDVLHESPIEIASEPTKRGREGNISSPDENREENIQELDAPRTKAELSRKRTYWVSLAPGLRETYIDIDPTSGTVLSYRNGNLGFDILAGGRGQDYKMLTSRTKIPEWTPEYEVVSKDEAFVIARRVFERFDQSLEIEDYTFSKEQGVGGDKHGYWWIRRQLSYDGVSFLDRYIGVYVSRYSGRVGSLSYRPIVDPPTKIETKIDKSEALRLAKKSMRRRPYFKWRLFGTVSVDYEVDPEDIEEFIVPGGVDGGNAEVYSTSDSELYTARPRYCWQVLFRFTENQPDLVGYEADYSIWAVYVDMETGKVIR
jgi:hypothetical protein